MSTPASWPARPGKRELTGYVVKGIVHGLSALTRPFLEDRLDGVEVTRDIPYADDATEDQLLDVYRPRGVRGPLPVVFYLHGGGFTIGSKETHWMFGAEFARAGYLTVVQNYRLAPEHPFPAAVHDAFAGWQWLVREAEALGADLGRVIIAGESAGANLTTALVLSCLQRRPETWAAPIFDLGVIPRAAILSCGFFNVLDLQASASAGAFSRSRIRNIIEMYMGGVQVDDPSTLDLVEAVRVFASDTAFSRPFPSVYISCGDRDPVLDHSDRIAGVLKRRGVDVMYSVFPGMGHAFQAAVFLEQARASWKETFAFLEARGLGGAALAPAPGRNEGQR